MAKDALVQELVDGFDDWPAQPRLEEPASAGSCGGAARMTSELYPYDALFSPIRVNRLTLKNRIVMAPMGNIDMCEETGRPNQKMLDYFFARAKGGCGLITTGLVPVSHGIDATVTEPGGLTYFPRIDRSRTVMAGWRDLAQGVHAFGSRIFVQLTAGLGRVGNPQCLLTLKRFPASASVLPNYYMPSVPCMRLSDRRLGHIVRALGQAAADASAMGLDGVYLHGHEGYLLEQMANPAFNHRRLGRYADWRRFGLDAVREIRCRVGPDLPIMYRIDLSLALEETYGEEVLDGTYLGRMRGGRSVEQTLGYMEELVAAGVDLFDVDLGCYDNWWLPHPPAYMPAGCFLDVAKVAKEYFKERGVKSNAGFEVPIVAVGKLNYPDMDEKALRDGKCDMIMLGRPVLADPDWCRKAYAGDVDQIRPCIGCQEACVNEFVEGGHPQCAVNPRTGHEDVLPKQSAPAVTAKKIGVVGGGPAGMNFAIYAAQRGHTVEILEKTSELGGIANAAAVPKNKYDMHNYVEWLKRQTLGQKGVAVKFGVEATPEYLKAQNYDAVIYAVGAKRISPRIPGIDTVNMVEATELLRNPEKLGGAKKVVVLGGGAVGMETAYWLSYEHGCRITVIDMLGNFMDGACTANRGHIIHYLEDNGAKLVNCATIKSFEPGRVLVSRNISKGAPDVYCTWTPVLPKNVVNPLAPKMGPETVVEEHHAELFVNALGRRADESQYLEGVKQHVAKEIYNIGDSFQAGLVWGATKAAYNLAQYI